MITIRLIILFLLISFAASSKDKVHYFSTSDSIKIGYLQIGDTLNPELIFIHGGPGDNSSDFRETAKKLALSFHVTIYDSRGAGFSQRNLENNQLTIEKMVTDLKELQEHLSIQSAYILGHSFGGAVAMEFGLLYPERVKKLILSNPVSSAAKARRNRMEYSYKKGLIEQDSVKIDIYNRYISGDSVTIWDEAKMVDASQSWYSPNTMDSISKTIKPRKLGYSKKTIKTAFYIVVGYYETGFFPNYSILDRIKNLECKTIIIGSTHDKLISVNDLENLNRLIQNSRLHIIQNCGHSPYIERPQEFLTIINSCL